MLREIRLRLGQRHSQRVLAVPAGTLTIVIGPNNAGKSLLLGEVKRTITGNIDRGPNHLVDSIGYAPLARESADALLSGRTGRRLPERSRAVTPPGSDYVRLGMPGFAVGDNEIRYEDVSVAELTGAVQGKLEGGLPKAARVLFVEVPTANRQFILDPGSGSHKAFNALLFDREHRRRLSQLVASTFGKHVCFDAAPQTPSQVRISDSPMPEQFEESWSEEARAFATQWPVISSFSDGIRCFIGALGVFLCSDAKIFVFDEPEAFLHPPLVRRLAGIVADLCAGTNATAVVSTHSPEFLMGAVQSARKTTVVRLSYDGVSADARVLGHEELEATMREPLLRSTGVLGALFYRGAVVCEGDTDRALYEEVNRRLAEHKKLAADECCFLNGNGKQTVFRIVSLLRRMGLPAAAVVDLDAIKGPEFRRLVEACGVPAAAIEGLDLQRVRVRDAFGSADPKRVGVAGCADVASARDLVERLASYGLFLVPAGELENWLSHLAINERSKTAWLVKMFSRLGSNTQDEGYVTPADDDVWAFVGGIARWLGDSRRNGMPDSG
jgi:ABC-type cobalamin/Fe3+-siderophores transport system ATPase subunit